MNNEHTNIGEFDRITPASMDVAPIPVALPTRQRKPRWLWPAAAISVVLAVSVFIWLPAQINVDNSAQQDQKTNLNENALPLPARGQQSSPWQEAQWAKQRKLSQQALGKLLDKHAALEKISVKQWAEVEFNEALVMAEKGDARYREKDYLGASAIYTEGANKMQAILQRSDAVFKQTLQTAMYKLEQSDSGGALSAFKLALALRPNDQNVHDGLRRAQNIDAVLLLKAEGEALEKQQQLDEALARYKKAQQLDPHSNLVIASINALTDKIVTREVNRAMAAGLVALQNNEFDSARRYFKQARRLSQSPTQRQEIDAAMAQTQSQQTLLQISQHKTQALQYQRQEKWQQASATYQAILTIDPNLDFAKKGLRNSQGRLRLEQRLLATIAQPERLANDKVYQQAKSLYNTAATVNNAGDRLKQQTRMLATLLQQAITPVDIVLESDALTDVTVYQVAHIGSFTQRTLSLKPGTYTAVGSRDGYRDVRKEFQVVLEQPVSPIVIKCREKIL